MNKTRELIKNIAVILLIIILCIMVFRIIASIVKNSKKSVELIYNTGSIKAELQKVPHYISVQSVVEGDPQVKVYPQVSGKFVRNAVTEGMEVKKDQPLVYIDRDQVGYQYEYAVVYAPVAGMVTKLYYIDKGAAVSPEDAVAEVADVNDIKAVFNVDQDDLLKLKKGQKARISYTGDNSIFVDGEVSFAPPVISSDTMAGTVVVKAPNKGGKMMIGMSVDVDIITDEKDSILVPEQAVLLGDEGPYLFINENGEAKQVYVSMGYKQNNDVEVAGPGLVAGTEIITDGSFKLSDGVKISTGAEESQKSKVKSQK